MAHSPSLNGRPTVLTVPGLNGSGPTHWQTIWERTRSDTVRVNLGNYDAPRRNSWVTRLDQAVRASEAPVILVAHSLGCLAVAWWASLSTQPWGWPVAGALLVAPPDVDRVGISAALAGFGPAPRESLPFPSIVVASDDDPYCGLQRTFDMARDWGGRFEEAGPFGHLNADSGLGAWHDGQRLLDCLIGVSEAGGATMTPADAQRALAQAASD